MSSGRDQRQVAVDRLTEQVKAAQTLYVTDFSGLSVLRMTEFRRRLRAAGAKYVVVKNTLAQRALTANKIEAFNPAPEGPGGPCAGRRGSAAVRQGGG